MLLVLLIAILIPCPSPSQFAALHIVMAVAGSSFVSSLSGFFQLHSGRLEIGSGLLVFLVLIIYNPVQPFVYQPCEENRSIRGIVYHKEQPLQGVVLHIKELEWWGVTSSDGSFTLPKSLNTLEAHWKLIVSYRDKDTVMQLRSLPKSQLLTIQLPVSSAKATELSSK
jgi:hypothetical protein